MNQVSFSGRQTSPRYARLLIVALVVAAGCKKDGATSAGEVKGTGTAPVLLSVGSPTKDEDPSVLRTRNGTLLIAWFSDRGNNPDIYVSRSVNKGTWNTPVRVTSSVGGDFYPNLFEDAQGLLHLVWFQWVGFRVGQIRHSTSSD